MNDFRKVAGQMFANGGHRVGGARILNPNVGSPAEQVPDDAGGQPVEYSAEVYRNGGNSYFGMGNVTVAAGASVTYNVEPIRPFLPLEFRVKSTVTGLMVVQVDIEGTLFFANKNEAQGQQTAPGMPVELLSEVSTMSGIEWETINPSTGVSITVLNPTAGSLVFSASFQGIFLRK